MVHIVEINGQVHHIVTGLRIGNFDTVQQHQRLIESTAIDADVRLYTSRAALTHVQAGHKGQHLVDGSNRQSVYLFTADDGNIAVGRL